MTALTQERDTKRRKGDGAAYPVAAGAKIFAGAIVVIAATGYANKGSTALNLAAVGEAKATVDNTSGANGDLNVEVDRDGWFRYANSAAADLITLADVGKLCYVVDDQTVAKTDGTGTRSVAGRIRDVDAQGVWIEFLQ